MAESYVLDTSTLIYLLAPRASARARACLDWFLDSRAAGARFYVPALAYHEAKRGADLQALRGDLSDRKALAALNRSDRVRVLAISNDILDRAAAIWATAKREGRTPDDKRLSGDVVIMAEARALRQSSAAKVIVTENVSDFERLGGVDVARFSDL